MSEYQIQPPTRHCARTGRELKPGEVCYSVLFETPDGLVRRDFAAETWDGIPDGALAFWKGRVPAPPTDQRTRTVDLDAIWELFEQLDGEADEAKRNFRYVLALLLLRRKALKLADVRRDGENEILVLRRPSDRTEYEVANPGLSDEQIEELQSEVSLILQTTG